MSSSGDEKEPLLGSGSVGPISLLGSGSLNNSGTFGDVDVGDGKWVLYNRCKFDSFHQNDMTSIYSLGKYIRSNVCLDILSYMHDTVDQQMFTRN